MSHNEFSPSSSVEPIIRLFREQLNNADAPFGDGVPVARQRYILCARPFCSQVLVVGRKDIARDAGRKNKTTFIKVGEVDKIVVANPLVDFRPGVDYPSRSKFDDARLMQSWPEFEWFIDQFATEENRRRLSVIVSSIQGIPKTSVVVGEYDMLLDEANAFVDIIGTAGFATETIMIRGAIHNSIELGPNTAAGERFIAVISDHLSI